MAAQAMALVEPATKKPLVVVKGSTGENPDLTVVAVSSAYLGDSKGVIREIRKTWQEVFKFPPYRSKRRREELLHYHDLITMDLERTIRGSLQFGPEADLKPIMCRIKFLSRIANYGLKSRQSRKEKK